MIYKSHKIESVEIDYSKTPPQVTIYTSKQNKKHTIVTNGQLSSDFRSVERGIKKVLDKEEEDHQ